MDVSKSRNSVVKKGLPSPIMNNSNNENQNMINEVWTKELFNNRSKDANHKKGYLKANLSLDIKPLKTTWASKKTDEIMDEDEDDIKEEQLNSEREVKVEELTSPTSSTPETEVVSPSHYARRPMNAFLIFCKKHRPIVRQKFPHLENRGVTRILGEWWALLEPSEKNSYTCLAKEYKDAFFSANPDFKWYKLPAPPLRTLNTRPIGFHKISSPLASPTQLTPNSAEFTPGKLADETQLGNLTSLMKADNSSNVILKPSDASIENECEIEGNPKLNDNTLVNNNNNNNVENDSELHKELLTTPPFSKSALLPKPIKKRKFEFSGCHDNKKVARNIFNAKPEELRLEYDQNQNSYLEEETDSSNDMENDNNGVHDKKSENMTQQELMNKVVDSMFPEKKHRIVEKDESTNGWMMIKQKSKETRKSGRLCKGKRYAEFMMEGKLLGSKQIKRITQYKLDVNNKFENVLNNKLENMMHNKAETQTPKLDLSDTIKRLAERTNTKLEDIIEKEGKPQEGCILINNKSDKRKRTESEQSDDSLIKLQSDFNLDLRISELPSLSYEIFLHRKKERKKRKCIRSKLESNIINAKVSKLSNSEANSLVGSKKRKNKSSIIRLEKPTDANYINTFNNDLSGLATLAEVAANTEKMN